MRRDSVSAAALQPSAVDRVSAALARFRGGQRVRRLRRVCAALLMVVAGTLASVGQGVADDGVAVVVAARDVPPGTELQASDVRTRRVAAAPDGAVASVDDVVGRAVTGPVRRGEILTDVRVLDGDGPRPGPGRVAVVVRPDDAAVVDLLSAGMSIAVVSLGADGRVDLLTDEAVVLSLPSGSSTGPMPSSSSRVVVLAVPEAAADLVTAASLGGVVGLRFA